MNSSYQQQQTLKHRALSSYSISNLFYIAIMNLLAS